MKSNNQLVLSVVIATLLGACSATPERSEPLESARSMVPELERSPRAGVAAAEIANARSSLDAANTLAKSKAKRADMEFEATNSVLSAKIANEKILTAQANEEVANGTAQRQAVLLRARERDAQASAQQAGDARREADASQMRADASQVRADSLESELADLKLKKTDRGLVLTLGDVLFDTGQATLKTGAYGTLDRLAKALQEQSGRSVVIEGHTDDVGSEASNQRLSEQRAQAVQLALQQRGVTTAQITAVGKGEGSPISGNDSAGGRQSNRRVELIFSEDHSRIAADEG